MTDQICNATEQNLEVHATPYGMHGTNGNKLPCHSMEETENFKSAIVNASNEGWQMKEPWSMQTISKGGK
jgi:hypothetical protein